VNTGKVRRIAILNAFNPEIYRGGIESFILNLRSLLEDYGIKVDLHHIYPEPSITIKDFPFTTIGRRIPMVLRDCFMLGRAFVKIERDYDLVISNNFYGLGYFSPRVKGFNIYHSTHAGYAGALKGRIPDKDYRQLRYLFGHAGDRLSGRGKVKIAVSTGVKDELKRYYGFQNVSVVNHGIDIELFRKIESAKPLRRKWNVPDDAFTGIFVGRWEAGKGIDIVEDVIKLHPAITWLLVIGNSECPLTGYKNVKVIKDADKETLRELYSLSDFMLFPSYYEGFGLAIIEAMACGLPVICTEVGVAKDLLRLNDLKKLILPICDKNELIKEITDRLSFLKKRNGEKNGIISAGRSIIERDYNIDVWKKRMAAILGLSN